MSNESGWIDVNKRGLPRRGPRYLEVKCKDGHIHRVEWGLIGYFATTGKELHDPTKEVEVESWRRVMRGTNNRS